MADTYYFDNYTTQYITKPSDKFPIGNDGGVKKVIIDKFTLVDSTGLVGLNNGDVIKGPIIPKGATVLNVVAKLSKSLGAKGVFSVGYAANGVDVADADAFIATVDGGGLAALQGSTYLAMDGIGKKFEADTQITVTCIEEMDDSVVDGVLTLFVEYVNA